MKPRIKIIWLKFKPRMDFYNIPGNMITELEYKALQQQHELACKQNDYSKMIMMGDENHKKLKEYEAEFVCKHTRIIELQGGQIERCADCGKEWG